MNYKKILEGVVDIINTTEKSDIGFSNICTYIGENCPELKQSEDERIRKELLSWLKNCDGQTLPIERYNACVAWLEKQGEQKPTDEEMKTILQTEYEKGRADAIAEIHRSTWSEEDETRIKTIIALLKEPAVCAMDGNKGIIEASIKYLKSLKDRVGCEVNCTTTKEWSEEDCNEIETIACHLDNIGNEAMAESLLNIMNKYKSCRPQFTWKPSDEQIRGIECAIKTLRYQLNVGDKRLDSLYYDLKKLKED